MVRVRVRVYKQMMVRDQVGSDLIASTSFYWYVIVIISVVEYY